VCVFGGNGLTMVLGMPIWSVHSGISEWISFCSSPPISCRRCCSAYSPAGNDRLIAIFFRLSLTYADALAGRCVRKRRS